MSWPLGGSDYGQLVQQQLLFNSSTSELSVAINIMDDNQYETLEQFFVRLSTVNQNVTLNPADTVVRILSNDGNILCISLISLVSYQSCTYNHVYTVVTFGFHQRQYMFLEGVGDATEVCVDRNGSTALPVTVTVDGSEFWTLMCFVDAIHMQS